MGCTTYSKTILGVIATREDFFTITGEHVACPRCDRRNFAADAVHCDKDGVRLEIGRAHV